MNDDQSRPLHDSSAGDTATDPASPKNAITRAQARGALSAENRGRDLAKKLATALGSGLIAGAAREVGHRIMEEVMK